MRSVIVHDLNTLDERTWKYITFYLSLILQMVSAPDFGITVRYHCLFSAKKSICTLLLLLLIAIRTNAFVSCEPSHCDLRSLCFLSGNQKQHLTSSWVKVSSRRKRQDAAIDANEISRLLVFLNTIVIVDAFAHESRFKINLSLTNVTVTWVTLVLLISSSDDDHHEIVCNRWTVSCRTSARDNESQEREVISLHLTP